MGDTSRVGESAQPQSSEVGKFVKEHWVEIALGVGVVAGLIIGALAQTDVIHHIGTISADTVTKMGFGGAVAAGVGIIIKYFISTYRQGRQDGQVSSKVITMQEIPREEETQPVPSEPETLPEPEIKPSAQSKPKKEVEFEEQKIRSSAFQNSNGVNVRVLASANTVSKSYLDFIQRRTEQMDQTQSFEEIKQLLDNTYAPPGTGIFIQVGNQYLVKGQFFQFKAGQPPSFINATEKAVTLPANEIRADQPLLLGTPQCIAALKNVPKNQFLEVQPTTVNFPERIRAILVENGISEQDFAIVY